MPVSNRAIAQLTVIIAAPAPNDVGVVDRAGVLKTYGNRFDSGSKTRHLYRKFTADHITVSKLSHVVGTPTQHAARGTQRAGMIATRRDRLSTRIETGDTSHHATIGRPAVAELT